MIPQSEIERRAWVLFERLSAHKVLTEAEKGWVKIGIDCAITAATQTSVVIRLPEDK